MLLINIKSRSCEGKGESSSSALIYSWKDPYKRKETFMSEEENLLPSWWLLKCSTHRPHTVRGDGDIKRKIVLINSTMAPQGAVINVVRPFTCRPSQTEAEVCLTTRRKINSITWPSRWWRLEIKFKGEASSYTWDLANKIGFSDRSQWQQPQCCSQSTTSPNHILGCTLGTIEAIDTIITECESWFCRRLVDGMYICMDE